MQLVPSVGFNIACSFGRELPLCGCGQSAISDVKVIFNT